MALTDVLKVIEGHLEGERFIMRKIGSYEARGAYKVNGLRSLARLIHEKEPFSLTVDKDRNIYVPVELNKQIKIELNLIADELEKGESRT